MIPLSGFSHRLRLLRKKSKLSQRVLAELVDVTAPTLSLWEKENRYPNYATLLKFADFFDVSLDYLIGRCENPSAHKA